MSGRFVGLVGTFFLSGVPVGFCTPPGVGGKAIVKEDSQESLRQALADRAHGEDTDVAVKDCIAALSITGVVAILQADLPLEESDWTYLADQRLANPERRMTVEELLPIPQKFWRRLPHTFFPLLETVSDIRRVRVFTPRIPFQVFPLLDERALASLPSPPRETVREKVAQLRAAQEGAAGAGAADAGAAQT